LLVEEATGIAWAGGAGALLAEGEDALALLTPPPVGEPSEKRRGDLIARALEQLAGRLGDLDAFAERRAQGLLADHERVRESSRAAGGNSVNALLPPDVIALYVLLPRVG
jgi:hypothetical protein